MTILEPFLIPGRPGIMHNMITTEALFAFIKERYDVTLEQHEFWTAVANNMSPANNLESSLIASITRLYPEHVQQNPSLIALTDPFFMGICLHGVKNPHPYFGISHETQTCFKLWTRKGERDLPSMYFNDFKGSLQKIFDRTAYGYSSVVSIAYYSKQVWDFFERSILASANSNSNAKTVTISEATAFKYASENGFVQERTNQVQLYTFMLEHEGDMPLLEMKRVFSGPHDNLTAWTVALETYLFNNSCGPEKDWMEMFPTFSALNLDLDDPNSWKFWHLLSTCCASDASGRNLLVTLSEEKPPMSQAFTDVWSIVDTLAEGDARYEHAVKMCKNPSIPLVSPASDLNMFEWYSKP